MDCYKKKAIHLLRTKQRKSLFRNRHKKSLYKKEGTKQMSRYSTSGVILSYNSVFCESNFILKYAFAEKNVCTDFENDEILCLDFYPVKVIYSSNQTYKYNNLIKSIWNLLYVDNLRDNSNNLRLNCDNSKKSVYNSENNFKIHKYKLNN